MAILVVILYLWLGSKSINFVKTRVLGLNYVYIESSSNFIFRNIFWSLFLGWLTIPIWIVLSLLGVGRK
ncbi:hypothetical protein N4T77_12585 [Clostridium sp. CX1]|uniref:hypothetical protein n=1 Tax=Clostridium sp. CX1 TaxID=2978346 RepID=UPI0021BEA3D5|nr:hypothetical protein [Clostridium sp. CX1]MCT8977440.1 hypothetical protein [Clostridium sp. CX1]